MNQVKLAWPKRQASRVLIYKKNQKNENENRKSTVTRARSDGPRVIEK